MKKESIIKIDKRIIPNGIDSNFDNFLDIYTKEGVDGVVGENTIVSVFNNLSAQGINNNTTAVLSYGINVFRTITSTNFCAKLPQPKTGKSTKVVNMTNSPLTLYPSNVGGRINNLPIDTPVTIPANGVVYTFTCIENPLPGAWVWTPPATGQHDSGVLTGTTTAQNHTLRATEQGYPVGAGEGFWCSTGWVWNAENTPTNHFSSPFSAFRPLTNWNAITKIKVYTNLIPDTTAPAFAISAAIGYHYYDAVTGDSVINGPATCGQYGGIGTCSETVDGGSGTPGTLTTNIGDPGTCYGELDTSMGGLNLLDVPVSFVGSEVSGPVPNPYNSNGPDVMEGFAGMISLQINTRGIYTDFKFRFIIEYN